MRVFPIRSFNMFISKYITKSFPLIYEEMPVQKLLYLHQKGCFITVLLAHSLSFNRFHIRVLKQAEWIELISFFMILILYVKKAEADWSYWYFCH